MAEEFDEKLKEVVAKDPRYKRGAYHFIFDALRHTQSRLGVRTHVTGGQLLEGIRDYAREQFGALARVVFREWGVHRTEDFGEIVFGLVDHGLMGKSETDSREDFRDVYDFDEAFPADYMPPMEPHSP